MAEKPPVTLENAEERLMAAHHQMVNFISGGLAGVERYQFAGDEGGEGPGTDDWIILANACRDGITVFSLWLDICLEGIDDGLRIERMYSAKDTGQD